MRSWKLRNEFKNFSFSFFPWQLRNLARGVCEMLAWLVQITFACFDVSCKCRNMESWILTRKRYTKLIWFHMRVQFQLEGIQVNLFRSDWVINNVEKSGRFLSSIYASSSRFMPHLVWQFGSSKCMQSDRILGAHRREKSPSKLTRFPYEVFLLGSVGTWLIAASLKFR